MPLRLSPIERRPSDRIPCGQVGAVPQKANGRIGPALLARDVQWRQPPMIRRANVGSGGDQQFDRGLTRQGEAERDGAWRVTA